MNWIPTSSSVINRLTRWSKEVSYRNDYFESIVRSQVYRIIHKESLLSNQDVLCGLIGIIFHTPQPAKTDTLSQAAAAVTHNPCTMKITLNAFVIYYDLSTMEIVHERPTGCFFTLPTTSHYMSVPYSQVTGVTKVTAVTG